MRVLSYAEHDLALAFAATAVDILSDEDWKKARTIMEARSRSDGRPNPLAEYFESRGHERGVREGLREGLHEGVQEGERRVLVKQLTLRFGAPPESAVARIAAADADTLERWAERVLTSSTLEEVLAD